MAKAVESTLVLAPAHGRGGWTSWPRTLLRFARRKPVGAFSAVIIASMLVAAAFADTQVPTGFTDSKPLLAPEHFDRQNLTDTLKSPTWDHPFGTDQLGRDMLSRVVYGTRTSVLVGLGSVFLAAIIATAVGVVSGYFGSWFDVIMQRLVDIWISFPALVLLLVFVEIAKGHIGLDPKKQTAALTIALGLLLAGGASRVIRGATLAIKNNAYVDAALCLGATNRRIILLHILPNVAPVIIVLTTLQLGTAILAEATVSFLGFGVPPPLPSWGQMLSRDGLLFFRVDPWLAFFPGMAIALAVYSFNMLGDSLRDVLDPRLRGSVVASSGKAV
ncbi:MAG TPA: ABC transporter permease [Dehalococcoidia bacterium]|nr:ABC transporter permease [Dehalococcoidia bacterium]